jgi:thioesterase domain-containing protein
VCRTGTEQDACHGLARLRGAVFHERRTVAPQTAPIWSARARTACPNIAHASPREVHAILPRVENVDRSCAELQTTWHREIPLAAAMALEIVTFQEGELVTRAPLGPNRNVHGTAFAGSLFSACVLTGWGRIWLALRERGLDGGIVVADSRIDYRKAVRGDVVCRCADEPPLDELAARGRAEFNLTCTVDGTGKPAVRFEGRYVVMRKRDD